MSYKTLISAVYCIIFVSISVSAFADSFAIDGYSKGRNRGPNIPPVHFSEHQQTECPNINGHFVGNDNVWGHVEVWINTKITDRGTKYSFCDNKDYDKWGSGTLTCTDPYYYSIDYLSVVAGNPPEKDTRASTGICTPSKTLDIVLSDVVFMRYRIQVISNDSIMYQAFDGTGTNVGTRLIEMKRIK
jgi:hypothetical protein